MTVQGRGGGRYEPTETLLARQCVAGSLQARGRPLAESQSADFHVMGAHVGEQLSVGAAVQLHSLKPAPPGSVADEATPVALAGSFGAASTAGGIPSAPPQPTRQPTSRLTSIDRFIRFLLGPVYYASPNGRRRKTPEHRSAGASPALGSASTLRAGSSTRGRVRVAREPSDRADDSIVGVRVETFEDRRVELVHGKCARDAAARPGTSTRRRGRAAHEAGAGGVIDGGCDLRSKPCSAMSQ